MVSRVNTKMMNYKRAALLVLAVALVVVVFQWISTFIEQDSCLDRGGRWNRDMGACESVRDQ